MGQADNMDEPEEDEFENFNLYYHDNDHDDGIDEESYSPVDSFFGVGVYEQAAREDRFNINVRKALQLSFRTYGIERTEDLIDTFYQQTPGTASRVKKEYKQLLSEYIAKGYEA